MKEIEEAGTPEIAVQVIAPVLSIPVIVVVAEHPPSKKLLASLSYKLVSSMSPLTSSSFDGAVVPIPTLPVLSIVILTALLVPKCIE